MAYAKLDKDNRIVIWSEEFSSELNVEFSNGDYVNKTCVNGLDDFIIENGVAIYSPKPQKEIKNLESQLSETDYIGNKFMDAVMSATDTEGILAAIAEFNTKYSDVIAERQEWRNRINELEAKIASV